MSVVLVVDSACDLPTTYLKANNIKILPINIKVNGTLYLDDKNEGRLKAFYDKNLLTDKNDAETTPYSSDQILDFILTSLATTYDYVIIQTVGSANSEIYNNTMDASHEVSSKYPEIRKIAKRPGKFGVRVVDTGTAFTGQALFAMYTIDLIRKRISKGQLQIKMRDIKPLIWTYGIPKDVGYVRERASKRGTKSVSAFGAFIGKTLDINPIICLRDNKNYVAAKIRGRQNAIEHLFNYAIESITDGSLIYPYIAVSFAGELSELEAMSGFQRLKSAAKINRVKFSHTVMNLSGGLLFGPDSVVLSLFTYTDSIEQSIKGS